MDEQAPIDCKIMDNAPIDDLSPASLQKHRQLKKYVLMENRLFAKNVYHLSKYNWMCSSLKEFKIKTLDFGKYWDFFKFRKIINSM